MNEKEEISRPIVLYVSHFQFEDISMGHLEKKRVSVIDVEMDYIEAEKLMTFLERRLKRQLPGTIRIRIYGTLVIS